MITLTPTQLNALYQRHMDWYPPVNNPVTAPQFVDNLAAIEDQFDLILLDSYGVLSRGAETFPQAIEAMQRLREKGIAFRVVSNDTTVNASNAEAKYRDRGFDFSADEVLTSLITTERFLQGHGDLSHVAVIAPEVHTADASLAGATKLVETKGVIPDHITTLLFLTGAGWDMTLQNAMVESANGRQFTLWIGNPDVGAPVGELLIPTPGYYLADFVARAGQVDKPVLLGKPDLCIFNAALEGFETIDPKRVLMIGDTLYTDVLGGNAMGFATLLLMCGVYEGSDPFDVINSTGIAPTFIAPTL